MIKVFPTKVDAFDDDNEPVFSVATFDEFCATVKLTQPAYTVESWRETAQAIEKALILLELENESPIITR